MKLKTNIIENSLNHQANYLCFLAKNIINNRYQTNDFYVLPYFVKNHSKTVYFPNLNYSPRFWQTLNQSKNDHYSLPFPQTAVLEAKTLLKNSSLVKTPSSSLKTTWPKLEVTLTNLIQKDLKAPHLLKKITTINLLPTLFGTQGSYHPTKKDSTIHLNLTHRLDFNSSSILNTILLSLYATRTQTIAELGQRTWFERNATIDFLFQNTATLKTLKHQTQTQITQKIIKDSHQYLIKLGFPSHSLFTFKNRQVYIQNQPFNSLTPQENSLLMLLIKNPNQIVTFDQAAETIWQEKVDDKFSLYAISKLIENLRKKITLAGINHQVLITKRSQGYILNN